MGLNTEKDVPTCSGKYWTPKNHLADLQALSCGLSHHFLKTNRIYSQKVKRILFFRIHRQKEKLHPPNTDKVTRPGNKELHQPVFHVRSCIEHLAEQTFGIVLTLGLREQNPSRTTLRSRVLSGTTMPSFRRTEQGQTASCKTGLTKPWKKQSRRSHRALTRWKFLARCSKDCPQRWLLVSPGSPGLRESAVPVRLR